ncbi:MAG: ABC transporter permease [Stackebrandtia sp.]
MSSFASLSKALFIGFLRDKVTIFFTIFFPLMFLVIFNALFSDPEAASSRIVTVGEVEILDTLESEDPQAYEDLFDVEEETDAETALETVRQGDADAAVRQDGTKVVVYFSAADPTRAAIVVNSLDGVVTETNLEILRQAADEDVPTYVAEGRQVEDESLTAIQFFTPGLLGFAVAISGVFGAAATLVSWRRDKILRRLRLTPVSIPSMLGARVGVSLTIAIVQMFVFIGVASLPFYGLRLTEYWWMAIPVLLTGTLALLALGTLVGGIAKTPEGASGLSNLVVMPMSFASGVFYPVEQSPQWLQTISWVSPLRHMNDALLAVMVRGEGPTSVLPQLGLLAAFTVAVSLIAWKMFNWDEL